MLKFSTVIRAGYFSQWTWQNWMRVNKQVGDHLLKSKFEASSIFKKADFSSKKFRSAEIRISKEHHLEVV